MRLADWSWNLLNLMALPLILGTGVDYSIFMQLALRRHQGDLTMAYRSVGRALVLCGATACAGFGSLAFSTNAGMGSLGQVCAAGIGSNMLISIFLLPIWWSAFEKKLFLRRDRNFQIKAQNSAANSRTFPPPQGPSFLYRAGLWRLCLWLARILPRHFVKFAARLFAKGYWLLAPRRREVVIQNLMPALNHKRAAATAKARSLFQQFSLKLVDLWRYEAGLPIMNLFGENSGWEHLEAARSQKRGVLLVTPHLGNWEFGAPWLARRGIALQVITMAEPTQDFTMLRQASRKRWNIETIVIGEDPFASVEVIKRLDAGETVALLLDRPPAATAVQVELFGQPFLASVAAAELARASGCVLLPVYLPRNEDAYAAHVLPPIPYDRAALRDRAVRQQLTQEIMRAFEPIIRQHLDQWFHFVPVWEK